MTQKKEVSQKPSPSAQSPEAVIEPLVRFAAEAAARLRQEAERTVTRNARFQAAGKAVWIASRRLSQAVGAYASCSSRLQTAAQATADALAALAPEEARR